MLFKLLFVTYRTMFDRIGIIVFMSCSLADASDNRL
jgi:hypothetical protein